MRDLQQLWRQLCYREGCARQIRLRAPDIGDETGIDRIASDREHDWNC
jgi:hypothetical protein